MRRPRTLVLALIGLAAAADSRADFTISKPTNYLATVDVTGCPKGCSAKVNLNPANVEHLAAAAKGGLLDKTFTQDIKQYPGWTLAFGGALNGNLSLATYMAVDEKKNCRGGAAMEATYEPGKKDPDGLTFVQVFEDNLPKSGTHIDPFPNTDDQPMYYTAKQRELFGLTFGDVPYDSCPDGCNGTVTVRFSAYMVTFDDKKKVVTAYDGWKWGFDLVCKPVPEPSSCALIGSGLLCLGLARVRSCRSSRTL